MSHYLFRTTQFSMVVDPGSVFRYGPAPFQVFGEVMRRKFAPRNEEVLSYLQRRIFDPIGMRYADWREQEGNPNLPSGAFMTACEWAKFGLLMRQNGRWQGKPVLPSGILSESRMGSAANPAYGLTFWLNADGIAADQQQRNPIGSGPADTFTAAGLGGQRLYIIPSLDLVVVRMGLLQGGSRFQDSEFLALLLER